MLRSNFSIFFVYPAPAIGAGFFLTDERDLNQAKQPRNARRKSCIDTISI